MPPGTIHYVSCASSNCCVIAYVALGQSSLETSGPNYSMSLKQYDTVVNFVKFSSGDIIANRL